MVDIGKFEQDALNEFTNMFSYQTSQVLSDIIGSQVETTIKSRNVISFDENKELTKDKDPILYLSIFSHLTESELLGNVVITFPKDSALKVYDALREQEIGRTVMVDNDVKNALIEIGNVVSGKILSVFDRMVGISVHHTVPTIVPSFGETLYDYVFFNIEEDKHEKAILIKVDVGFDMKGHKIEGQIIVLLTAESFDTLLEKIDAIKPKENE